MLSGTESQLHTRIMERTKRVCIAATVIAPNAHGPYRACAHLHTHKQEARARIKVVKHKLFLDKMVLDNKPTFS